MRFDREISRGDKFAKFGRGCRRARARPPFPSTHRLAPPTIAAAGPMDDEAFASLLSHTLRTGLKRTKTQIVVDIISDPN